MDELIWRYTVCTSDQCVYACARACTRVLARACILSCMYYEFFISLVLRLVYDKNANCRLQSDYQCDIPAQRDWKNIHHIDPRHSDGSKFRDMNLGVVKNLRISVQSLRSGSASIYSGSSGGGGSRARARAGQDVGRVDGGCVRNQMYRVGTVAENRDDVGSKRKRRAEENASHKRHCGSLEHPGSCGNIQCSKCSQSHPRQYSHCDQHAACYHRKRGCDKCGKSRAEATEAGTGSGCGGGASAGNAFGGAFGGSPGEAFDGGSAASQSDEPRQLFSRGGRKTHANEVQNRKKKKKKKLVNVSSYCYAKRRRKDDAKRVKVTCELCGLDLVYPSRTKAASLVNHQKSSKCKGGHHGNEGTGRGGGEDGGNGGVGSGGGGGGGGGGGAEREDESERAEEAEGAEGVEVSC